MLLLYHPHHPLHRRRRGASSIKHLRDFRLWFRQEECCLRTGLNAWIVSQSWQSWPSLENSLPELKTVLSNANFVIEGYVDPTEPLRDEGPFGDHTGYYTLAEPYPVFHVTAMFQTLGAL